MMGMIAEIIIRFPKLLVEHKDWLSPPPPGWHVELKGGATLVFQKYEDRPALIAITCFEPD
jgi:hypothetical protein